jgi:hypothetical protein
LSLFQSAAVPVADSDVPIEIELPTLLENLFSKPSKRVIPGEPPGLLHGHWWRIATSAVMVLFQLEKGLFFGH